MTEYRIWPATNGPDTSGSDGQPINLGTEFYVTSQAWVTQIAFYRGDLNVQPNNLRVYQVDSDTTGTVVAEVVTPVFSGGGWQLNAVTPTELTVNQRYRVVGHFPDNYTATGGYWTGGGPGSAGITNGILVAPNTANATGTDQGSFKYDANSTFPDSSFNGGNYWVDVIVTDVDPSGAVTVDVAQALESDSAHAIALARVVLVGQASEVDTGDVVTPGSAAETNLRVRVSGTEPTRFIQGTEPRRQVSGNEVGT